MKVGIAVDKWKLPTFRAILMEAGFPYTEGDGLTIDTGFMTVETDEVERLKTVVEKCQMECRKKS